MPQRWSVRLSLAQFQRYRGWVAIVAFLTGISLLVSLCDMLWKDFSASRTQKKALQERNEQLHTLSPAQRKILAYYVANETETQDLLERDGDVAALELKDIVYQASFRGWYSGKRLYAYNIHPWAKEYLKDHVELLFDPATRKSLDSKK
jgi:hypothetical protein